MSEQDTTPEQDAVLEEFDALCKKYGLPMDMGYMEMVADPRIEIPPGASAELEAWHERYMEAFPGSC